MPTAILEKRKFKRNLVIVFVILVSITALIVRQNFSPGMNIGSVEVEQNLAPKKVEINFDILDSKTYKDLQPFQGINPLEGSAGNDDIFQGIQSLEGKPGRDNPFLIY